MAKRSVLGLYTEEDSAADALDNLRDAGFGEGEYEILTGTPYPEGTFGEAARQHKLYRWPLIGAACGFATPPSTASSHAIMFFTAGRLCCSTVVTF